MARFGKLPVLIPENVTVTVDGGNVTVVGPKGTLIRRIPSESVVKIDGSSITIEKNHNSKLAQALQGTMRAHIQNMITGVSQGWTKQLEVSGPGYRAEVRGNELVLSIGFSHPVVFNSSENLSFKVEKSIITVEGIDRDVVGQMAALIRKSRPANPYTGTGMKYTDEIIRRKAGKQATKGA